MYVGRIILVGLNNGKGWVGYRVSSRSYPNRKAEIWNQGVRISPLDSEDLKKNPYISYNCIRIWKDLAIVANGTQSDMVLDKILDGQKPSDAIVLALLAYGFERDEFDTPRLVGIVRGNTAWLGIVERHEFRVKEFHLQEGNALMVTTYEKTDFEQARLSARNAAEIAKLAFELDFEKPICAAAAMAFLDEQGFELAVYNPHIAEEYI
jgi:IMP cyclohydrolase